MASPPDDRLDSWKEIAAYLKRGVRTVRRWERDEGLPVHRHVHRVLGSVYAYKSEIDEWQNVSRSSPARPPSGRPRRSSAPTAKSIAVLPFANLSTDRENEYFADGLTDELTSGLSRIAALRVTSRTSAMTFKGSNKDADTIARELGVRYIIEGSVRRAGDRLRIAARLIDGAADALVWADTWDGSVEDVFTIQERLSRVIIGALEVRLTASEDRRLADRPSTTCTPMSATCGRARKRGAGGGTPSTMRSSSFATVSAWSATTCGSMPPWATRISSTARRALT